MSETETPCSEQADPVAGEATDAAAHPPDIEDQAAKGSRKKAILAQARVAEFEERRLEEKKQKFQSVLR